MDFKEQPLKESDCSYAKMGNNEDVGLQGETTVKKPD